MDYQVVFDITDVGYKSWRFPAHGLTFVVLGVALVVFRKRLPGWPRKYPRLRAAFSFLFLGFSVIWTLVTFVATYSEYSSLLTAKKTGQAKVIEGNVRDFEPMPVTGHSMERFCVQDTCFEYSDYVITAGFNNTTSHRGPIKEGLPVRVTYVGNAIAKLEVIK